MADSSVDVKSWYNNFSKSQLKTNVNLRHYTVVNNVINSASIKKNSKILEIGCGIGTLTGLLLKYLSNNGKVVATDISDGSIEIAKERLGTYNNVDFVITDMSNFDYNEKFDAVVLPDVLEHIPVEQHQNIFNIIANLIHEKSIVVINIPHALSLDFMRRTAPEKLQIIDQSLDMSFMLKGLYASGLVVIDLKSYSIYTNEPDYISITCKLNRPVKMTNYSKSKIIKNKLFRRLEFFFKRIF